MAYECINDVHQARHEWKEALDKPFDADALAAIYDRYQRGLCADAVYRRVYKEERAAYLADVEAAREAKRAELAPLTKRQLVERMGYGERITKADLIEDAARNASSAVESEHERVRRRWAAMSADEQIGK